MIGLTSRVQPGSFEEVIRVASDSHHGKIVPVLCCEIRFNNVVCDLISIEAGDTRSSKGRWYDAVFARIASFSRQKLYLVIPNLLKDNNVVGIILFVLLAIAPRDIQRGTYSMLPWQAKIV
jgi:hypothetical protein